jgi:hypothetical protein
MPSLYQAGQPSCCAPELPLGVLPIGHYAGVGLRGRNARSVAITMFVVALVPSMVPVGSRSLDARADAIRTARYMSATAIERYEQSNHVEPFGPYKITVPRSWQTTTPDEQLCQWPGPDAPQLVRLRPRLPTGSCPSSSGTVRQAIGNGAILYSPGAEPFDWIKSPGPLLLTLRPGFAVTRVYGIPGQPRHLLVKFRDGGYAFQISVAVGRDGRVAGRIIGSIQSNPDDA